MRIHHKREALLLIGAALMIFVSACGKKTSSSSSAFVPGYYYGGTTPVTTAIPDAATCSSFGGTWVAGNTCKFTYPYIVMGGWSGYYWLAGAPNVPSVPLVRPGAPTELDQAG